MGKAPKYDFTGKKVFTNSQEVWAAFYRARAKNPRLKITPRAGWVEVEEVRF